MAASAHTGVFDSASEARREDLRWRAVRAKVVLYCVSIAVAGVLVGNAHVLPFLLAASLLYGSVMSYFATVRARAVLASQRDPASGELPFVRLCLTPAGLLFVKARQPG